MIICAAGPFRGACVVGLIANAKEIMATHRGFAPSELNEGNVQAIFNRCLASEKENTGDIFSVRGLCEILSFKETPLVYLSDKNICLFHHSIQYQAVQINRFHNNYSATPILQEGFNKT